MNEAARIIEELKSKLPQYQNARLTEEGVWIGSQFIPSDWLEGDPTIQSEYGRFHRLVLTVFVDGISIDGNAHFKAVNP
ncbi:hypothetical protein SEA_SWISSCHEESE_85 [Mycobacterium phage SwissCheese]|uniref:Uncharacterized protein n=3 Tax=Fromanvirus TaxID=186764 RepID=G1D3D3_9CAUD|nr:hypothetical protein CM08_gp83 [Mycobacterium phage Bruns]YP_009016777.1 hypothetical protein CL80_gp82 [Mycobacterium phage Euphoria]YP_009636809.1 hypothetical protein FGG24_gp84 [Mycobacterium phage JC27]AVJ49549.1 hypothetical protein SEA_CORVO_84 [Mycobacterium phage Corvo]AVJ49732.1 hypothetical protein SEA_FORSYTHEAST_84 [Mycobacterium phage Forsytheast]AXH45252.1 hypothetical protein SEA_SWISSCHEESE_85 [Mycobacterium phage SwissCheese]AXH46217.1 hypothetical protein SEA_MOOSE_84 [M